MAAENRPPNVNERTYQEVEYLKKNLGPVLVAALAEICIRRPADPIEYLGHWLLRWRYNEELKRRDVQHALEVVHQKQLDNAQAGLNPTNFTQGVTPAYPNLPPGYGGPLVGEEEEEEELPPPAQMAPPVEEHGEFLGEDQLMELVAPPDKRRSFIPEEGKRKSSGGASRRTSVGGTEKRASAGAAEVKRTSVGPMEEKRASVGPAEPKRTSVVVPEEKRTSVAASEGKRPSVEVGEEKRASTGAGAPAEVKRASMESKRASVESKRASTGAAPPEEKRVSVGSTQGAVHTEPGTEGQ